ncbi:hypothetical protein KKQ77_06480 [Leptospira interrogans]|nr:hypothetical protein [Leptospira interrogans]EKR84945.1 hypothetical protein LEP1GSC099_0414 [Leptospira interrogans str. UI 08452]EMF32261.1 hypothetical protein LEP1GSC201_3491 [Leptospira interrogans serovar Pomona str. Fox 32256]EMN34823.1 hypothetical protein LEP1GSC084_2927 [Leptospira interrogans serovar Medanensis str. L0448]EMN39425.1 hypothetical protein LEP1GSC085_1883 [Leptospira interrogans str. L0996]MBV6345027.1 hypothetical protein [Leptospira interrogans]
MKLIMTPASVPEPLVSLVLAKYFYLYRKDLKNRIYIRAHFLPSLSSVIRSSGLSLG